MDNGMVTGAVFIDLTKAYDTVNHSILLSKLNSLGDLDDFTAYNGLSHILPTDVKLLPAATTANRIKHSYRLECHKAQSLALCYLPCTSMTYQTFWNTVTLLYMQMTLSYLFLPNPFIASNQS